jgi:hypothetical protein
MLAAVDRAGLSSEHRAESGSSLSIWITFDPQWGSAGVVVTQKLLRRLASLSADVFLSAFAQE